MTTLDSFAHRRPLGANAYAKQPFDRDRLMLVSRDRAMNMAFAILDRVQQEQTPEVAMAGVAIMFAAWCRRVGMDAREAHDFAARLLRTEDHHVKANVQAETIRDFAGIRLVGDKRVTV